MRAQVAAGHAALAHGYAALAQGHRQLAPGHGPAPGRGAGLMFDSFRRWPLVPSSQLVRLRSALLQCVELASPDNGRDLSESAGKLLQLVTDELDRRTGPSAGQATLRPGFRQARRRPHA